MLINITKNLEKASSHIRRLYISFAMLFVGVTVYISFFELERSVSLIKNISVFSLFLCSGLIIGSYLLRVWRWLIYMRLLDENSSTMHHVWIYFSGFAFTVSPGKTGELMRSFFLKPLSIPFEYSFGCFVSERFFDIISVLLLGAFYLQLEWFNAFCIVLTFIILPIAVKRTILIISVLFKSYKIYYVLKELPQLWKYKITMKVCVISLFAWFFQGVILFIVLNEMNTYIDVSLAVSIYCLSLLIGALSLIPSGIGATELGMSWLLTQVGIDAETAAIAALVTRSLTLLPSLALGLVSSYILRKCY